MHMGAWPTPQKPSAPVDDKLAEDHERRRPLGVELRKVSDRRNVHAGLPTGAPGLPPGAPGLPLRALWREAEVHQDAGGVLGARVGERLAVALQRRGALSPRQRLCKGRGARGRWELHRQPAFHCSQLARAVHMRSQRHPCITHKRHPSSLTDELDRVIVLLRVLQQYVQPPLRLLGARRDLESMTKVAGAAQDAKRRLQIKRRRGAALASASPRRTAAAGGHRRRGTGRRGTAAGAAAAGGGGRRPVDEGVELCDVAQLCVAVEQQRRVVGAREAGGVERLEIGGQRVDALRVQEAAFGTYVSCVASACLYHVKAQACTNTAQLTSRLAASTGMKEIDVIYSPPDDVRGLQVAQRLQVLPHCRVKLALGVQVVAPALVDARDLQVLQCAAVAVCKLNSNRTPIASL